MGVALGEQLLLPVFPHMYHDDLFYWTFRTTRGTGLYLPLQETGGHGVGTEQAGVSSPSVGAPRCS